MRNFAEAILSTEDDQLSCDECQLLLPEYIHTALLTATIAMEESPRQGGDSQLAAVALHLRFCPHCAKTVQELLELMESAYDEELPLLPISETHVDLGFLATAPPLSSSEHQDVYEAYTWNQLGQFVITFSKTFLRAVTSERLSTGGLDPAWGGVRSTAEGSILYEIALDQREQDLLGMLTVRRRADQSDQCEIHLEIEIPSRNGWPNLANITVALHHGEVPIATKVTNAFGQVSFAPVAMHQLPNLQITISPVV